jgi:hypothetical protein
MASADFSDTCSAMAKHDADQHVARSNLGDRESPLTGRGDRKVAGTRPGCISKCSRVPAGGESSAL